MRQLNQFGVEVLGSSDPAADAEVIDLAMSCYKELGLKSLKLVINSLGDSESRESHRQALVDHFTPYKDELCGDCQTRLEQIHCAFWIARRTRIIRQWRTLHPFLII